MNETPIKAFFVSAVVLRIRGAEAEVLLMERADTLQGAWCQVAGKVEANETAWQAALREVGEETGLTAQRLFSADICEQFYEPDRDAISMAPVFVVYVAAEQAVVLNEEHSAHRWLGFDAACDLVSFGGQRRVLRWIEEEFIRRTPSPHLAIDLTGLAGLRQQGE